MTAAKFISDLVARGRYCFSAEEAGGALGANAVAIRSGLLSVAWAQRLGYLLDMAGAQQKTGELAKYIAKRKPVPTPLAPSLPFEGIGRLKPCRICTRNSAIPDS